MRRITSIFFCCSVCSWAACATSQTVTARSDFVSQGVFVDAVLAEPPQQRVPWTAPKSRLPKEFIAATTASSIKAWRIRAAANTARLPFGHMIFAMPKPRTFQRTVG